MTQRRRRTSVSVYEEKNSSYYVKDTALSVSRRVMTPLNSWMEDFEAATGCSNVNIVAGYRSLDYQQQLYDAAVQNHGSDYAASYLAQPGCSEHHTGLAIDFALYLEDSGATADFTGTGDYAWLVEHAWEYGFIRRYPADKRDVTASPTKPGIFAMSASPTPGICRKTTSAWRNTSSCCGKRRPKPTRCAFPAKARITLSMPPHRPQRAAPPAARRDNLGGYIVTVTE